MYHTSIFKLKNFNIGNQIAISIGLGPSHVGSTSLASGGFDSVVEDPNAKQLRYYDLNRVKKITLCLE
jgi:hypothetical protein